MGERAQSEGGFTLIELLVVSVIGVLVLGGGTTLLISTVRGESDQRDRSAQVQQARVAVERLTREVRQGDGVVSAEDSSLVLETYVKRASCGGPPAASAIRCRVTYQCGAGSCTRAESAPGVAAAGGGVRVVEGLLGNDIFSYLPADTEPKTFVEIELQVGNEGEADSVTVDGGVALRNAVIG